VGLGYLELGFTSKAEKIFNDILRRAETLDCKQKSMICLSRIDLIQGNPEKAEERLNLFLYSRDSQVEPSLAEEAHHILGDAYFQEQRYQEAVKEYSIALKKQVKSFRHAKSLYRLGESFGKIGYYYNAVQFLKRMTNIADEIHPETKEIKTFKDEAWLLIGDYLSKKGNYNAAINAYKNLAKSTPDKEKKAWALLKWGETLIETGDYGTALKVFADVAEKMPYSFLGSFAQEKIKEIKLEKGL
jgi:tetratricopeptide (TPR) repeat protein